MGVRAEPQKTMMSRRSKLAGEARERNTLNTVKTEMMTKKMFLLRTRIEIRNFQFVLDDGVR